MRGDRRVILTPSWLTVRRLVATGGVGMKGVATIGRIRREHFVRGKAIKEIVRELHVSRNTVRKVLRTGATAFGYEREVQPLPRIAGPGRPVGSHPRCFGRDQTIFDFWHYVPVLARKPGVLRTGAAFKDWVLPTSLDRLRRKLAGATDGDRQMVDILTSVLSDGLPAVNAACAEALGRGVHSQPSPRRLRKRTCYAT